MYFVAKVKEKTMANKNFWLGILVMVLVFGMTVVGCDNGSTDDDGYSLNGTTWVWLVPPDKAFTLVFSVGSFTFTIFDSNTSAVIQAPSSGTYTISGNIVTMVMDDGDHTEQYRISGNTLTNTIDSNVVYVKQ
jgi:hypothetical protein